MKIKVVWFWFNKNRKFVSKELQTNIWNVSCKSFCYFCKISIYATFLPAIFYIFGGNSLPGAYNTTTRHCVNTEMWGGGAIAL
jgi:hypothetical protein